MKKIMIAVMALVSTVAFANEATHTTTQAKAHDTMVVKGKKGKKKAKKAKKEAAEAAAAPAAEAPAAGAHQ